MKVNAASRPVRLVLTAVIVLACIAVATASCTQPPDDDIECDLTVVGDGEIVLTYADIKAMTPYEGRGGFFNTVGIVYGPFEARGVPLESVCDLVGGVGGSDAVRVSAPDGYSMVFSYDQLGGDFATYDPVTMREQPHGELEVILMYEQDGEALSQEYGRPLRVAIVGADGLLTEGAYWVKWVNRVEVMSLE